MRTLAPYIPPTNEQTAFVACHLWDWAETEKSLSRLNVEVLAVIPGQEVTSILVRESTAVMLKLALECECDPTSLNGSARLSWFDKDQGLPWESKAEAAAAWSHAFEFWLNPPTFVEVETVLVRWASKQIFRWKLLRAVERLARFGFAGFEVERLILAQVQPRARTIDWKALDALEGRLTNIITTGQHRAEAHYRACKAAEELERQTAEAVAAGALTRQAFDIEVWSDAVRGLTKGRLDAISINGEHFRKSRPLGQWAGWGHSFRVFDEAEADRLYAVLIEEGWTPRVSSGWTDYRADPRHGTLHPSPPPGHEVVA